MKYVVRKFYSAKKKGDHGGMKNKMGEHTVIVEAQTPEEAVVVADGLVKEEVSKGIARQDWEWTVRTRLVDVHHVLSHEDVYPERR